MSRAEYKVEKKIQTDYTFISTSLFRGCPLVRRFDKNILYLIIVVMKLNLIYACQMIRNFSLRHKLHLLLALLYGECDERMHQEIK